MKKRQKILKLDSIRIMVLLAIIVILALVTLFFYLANKFINPSEKISLTGEPAEEFCTNVCEEKELGDLVYSVNDTNLNLIACECVTEIYQGEGKYTPVASIKTKTFYFNSSSLEESTLTSS